MTLGYSFDYAEWVKALREANHENVKTIISDAG